MDQIAWVHHMNHQIQIKIMKTEAIKTKMSDEPEFRFTNVNSISKILMVFPFVFSIFICISVMAQEAEEIPFFLENFEDGDAMDGDPVSWRIASSFGASGQGEIIDGSYVLVSRGRCTVRSDDSILMNDVSIRVQVRRLSPENDSILVAAHGQEDGRGYMASVNDNGMHLWISTGMSPVPTSLSFKLNGSLNTYQKDINLQFDVVGKKLSLTAWAEGSNKPSRPQLTASAPNLLPPGFVGINTDAPKVAIRKFDAIRIGNSLPFKLEFKMYDEHTVEFSMPIGYVIESSPTLDSGPWTRAEGKKWGRKLRVPTSSPFKFYRLAVEEVR